jgi:3'-phosphoadenosine 5'-phosphosulfate sulfotransferase (PAPS reductase)/FAD synthetase
MLDLGTEFEKKEYISTDKLQYWQLCFRQGMPLWMKEKYTEKRIIDWYDHFNGEVYVSFSGGKDSLVLLHQVRKLYPDVLAVFSDTGLEYPEIRQFVKTIDNVVWVKPKMSFKDVIKKYGYPVVSKEISQKIYEFRASTITGNKKHQNRILFGGRNGNGKMPDKWKFMIDAPFKISDQCCDALKKSPIHTFEKETGLKPFIGTMAQDSRLRKTRYLKVGCNSYEGKERSAPMSFWREEDIWEYIKENNLDYSDIYKMGYERTGCMFCMFGIHLDSLPNRFQKMKKTHPKQYDFCMDKLGIRDVLGFMKIPVEENQDHLFSLRESTNARCI